jgi:hypothetical protein
MILDAEELELCLHRWGRVFGEKPKIEPEELSDEEEEDARALAKAQRAETLLARAAEMGLRTKRTEAAPMHTNRSRARLALMGAQAGASYRTEKGAPLPVPAWAADPVRGRQTNAGGAPWSPDPVAELVERAVLSLHRFDRLMATCLRVEYCTRGLRFREKVARAGFHLELLLPAREYRRGLDRAKVWIAGRLS